MCGTNGVLTGHVYDGGDVGAIRKVRSAMSNTWALAEDSPFAARAFIAGEDVATLAADILTLDQDAFSAAFRKAPMKRAKLAGLHRNAAVVLHNVRSTH